MGEQKSAKEQEIIANAVKQELDFITYVDVDTKVARVIVTNEKAEVTPPPEGDYDEINRRAIPDFVHPQDQEYCARQLEIPYIQKELEQKERMVVPYRLLCGTEYRRKELNIYYHDDGKKTLVLVRRDVTDSYEAEQRQNERIYYALMEAKHANQEKNEFLERMSHEIRTPMNSIVGLSYLTRENADNEKQVLENLEKINKSAHFLLSFINDILNLSQIESGNVALIQKNMDFDTFLEDISRDIEKKAKEKQIRFSVEKRSDFHQKYRFDPEMLKKALMNILENAVKFTQSEGKVDFIIERLYDTEADVTLRFEIRDTGTGMEESFLPHVFEPFEQEGNENTTLNGGTGLSLAISKNIIDFMGGRIDVYSEKGKGSTFVVTVHLEKVAEDEADTEKQSRSERLDYDFTGKRVLLVEDNEINIEITRNILTHKNFEVEVAVNGEEGVSCFLNHEPGYYDVILMDIRMPVMDGLAATRKIREAGHADSEKIPIVAMTANVFEEDVRKSFEAGMDAHLSKPVDIRQMYFVLDNMIYG